jgi:preprotein translocase subunit SecB
MEEEKKQEIKKSTIQISDLSLISAVFKKKTSRLKQNEIPTSALSLVISIQEIDDLAYLSLCAINAFQDDDPNADFIVSLNYQIITKASDPVAKNDLQQFARFGAPFNALVHARELISSLTARAFGKAATLPLLDIREMGKSLRITMMEKPKEASPPIQTSQPEVEPAQ